MAEIFLTVAGLTGPSRGPVEGAFPALTITLGLAALNPETGERASLNKPIVFTRTTDELSLTLATAASRRTAMADIRVNVLASSDTSRGAEFILAQPLISNYRVAAVANGAVMPTETFTVTSTFAYTDTDNPINTTKP